jgi:hypothetical protein
VILAPATCCHKKFPFSLGINQRKKIMEKLTVSLLKKFTVSLWHLKHTPLSIQKSKGMFC